MASIRVAGFALVAWIVFCAFQQSASPQTGKPRQDPTDKTAQLPQGDKKASGASAANASGDRTAPEDTAQKESRNHQEVYVAAPEPAVDEVSRTVNVLTLICTVILAGAGVYGVRVGVRTLRILRRQAAAAIWATRAATRSANAAKASIGLLINKERARIRVQPGALSLPASPIHSVEYKVFNYGYTRAFVQRAQVEITVSADKNPPRRPEHSWPMGLTPAIEPSAEGYPFRTYFFPLLALTPEQVAGVKDGQLFVHFWGAVYYKDVFFEAEKDLRVTRFTYIWLYSDLTPPPGSNQERHGYWIKNGNEGEDYYET